MRWTSPNKYGRARPHTTAVALGTGAWSRRNTWRGTAPSRPCGEACRPLAVQYPPTCRGRPAELATRAVLLLPNPERTASNRDSHRPVTLSGCLSKLMERTPAARIRDVIESQLTPQPSCFLPGNSTPDQLLHLRAAMHRNAPEHRTAAVFWTTPMPLARWALTQ
ncbi:hypothetical protein C3747_1g583 [Trypanosoma cruzi]|uniref:Uncharacterized protein n=1 Tax=Trypanosoma cruzi TaxID=5693 RepID=A0A2V2XNN2_TRYCR|nr:hypothetical protein C3747_1g591 [Trypanosoma cruzi]PWV22120.1 hypothetical protein C3747_1g587 [Trypanosoma cruzi]PWV22123.1 hypothetical protein C3747_1g583 [Trypanosoma cruzi]